MSEQDTEETTMQVCFSISGEFMTKTARDFVQEGNWRKGYRFLTESLDGLTAEQALSVLSGKMKFDGVNDLELVEDKDGEKKVNGWLEWQFRNCFEFRGKLYRPYGYVSAFRKEDYDFACTVDKNDDPYMAQNRAWYQAKNELWKDSERSSSSMFSESKEVYSFRSCYYLKNRESDICVECNVGNSEVVPVCCEEVEIKDVPLWYQPGKEVFSLIREMYKKEALTDLYTEMWHHLDALEDIAAASMNGTALDEVRFEENRRRYDELERQYAQEDAAKARMLAMLTMQVQSDADQDAEFGWAEFNEFDNEAQRNVSIRVPGRAFRCAALRRAHAQHLMPQYTPRSPSGLKMPNDCRYHTDSWLGAGFKLEDAYSDEMPEQRLFMKKLYELQRELLSSSFDTLARGKDSYVYGEVIHDPMKASKESILVLKEARPEYAAAALKCAAVIVETGSKLAHLVVVSREESIPVIRVPGATTRFHEGRRLSIDFEDGTVEMTAI